MCITLAPSGMAYVERAWRAVRWRWVRDAPPPPPGVGPSTEPAGPLAPGRYRLRLQTMLQVGGDETSAPAAWVEVAPR